MTGLVVALSALLILTQGPRIDRIDPPHWWSGMGVDTLELLVEGANLTGRPVRVQGRGVSLISATAAGNSRYQYLRVQIAPDAPSQTIKIIADGQPGDTALFELRQRGRRQDRIGLDQSDVMYLVMADRFANGDTANDVVNGMRQDTLDRNDPYGRHGGDLAGVRRHVGYLDSLGVTALWLCPVLENDEPRSSYHGYAITDHYRVDP
ncbi:MAG: cyclomaltodextrinase N-terminal domain-containing protein, partial [Bacteroidota bacterium]